MKKHHFLPPSPEYRRIPEPFSKAAGWKPNTARDYFINENYFIGGGKILKFSHSRYTQKIYMCAK